MCVYILEYIYTRMYIIIYIATPKKIPFKASWYSHGGHYFQKMDGLHGISLGIGKPTPLAAAHHCLKCR